MQSRKILFDPLTNLFKFTYEENNEYWGETENQQQQNKNKKSRKKHYVTHYVKKIF